MTKLLPLASCLSLVLLPLTLTAHADTATVAVAGTTASGNVDGVITWQLGDLTPGSTVSRTALLAHASGLVETRKLLERARLGSASVGSERDSTEAEAEDIATTTDAAAWIANGVTDFALEPDGGFFWERSRRQALRGPHGGQLSRLGWFVRYRLGDTDRRAGVRISSAPRREKLTVIAPARRVGPRTLKGRVATSGGELAVDIRASLDEGSIVTLRFSIASRSDERLEDLELSVYANLEAAHDHENDRAFLAPETGVTIYDPGRKILCILAGAEPPSSARVGTWPSEDALIDGAGPAPKDWPPLPDLESYRPPRPSIATLHPGAPRITGATEPETRTLSADEGTKLLVEDWLFQAEGKPLAARATEEIAWARKLAARIAAMTDGRIGREDLADQLEELNRLEKQLNVETPERIPPADAEELYLAVRDVKRRIVFANPVIDFDRLLFIDQPNPEGSEWPHQARHRNGFMAMPGGRILILDGLHPAGQLRKLSELPPGAYWKPDLSFDARRLVFCYKANDEESFHLWEIGIDGSGLRRLTGGPRDDLDPIYLPDGGLAFVTTRGETWVRCMPYTRSNVLARCDADGSNIRLISYNNEPDWHPILMPDGRILFSRWEYTDKALWRIQSLWTVRPDGTGLESFWGNQSVWPDHPTEARPIPGSSRVMFTGTAHHDYFAGSIGIIDNRLGLNYPRGLTRVTRETGWPESGNGPAEKIHDPAYHTAGQFIAYKSPFPLGAEDFLVSARAARGRWKIYLMDTSGNRELVYQGAHNCWYPVPLRPRQRPPALPIRTRWRTHEQATPAPGFFFSSDVLEGVDGIVAARVKHLRIIRSDYKTYTLWARDYRYEGPAVSIVQAESVKQILGTVPVESDGSVYFQAPSSVPLHFQLLDGQYRALHTMRSFTGLMPGELRGCVGCHEGQNRSPEGRRGIALTKPPAIITAPPWGDATIGYERLVQPVLDRHCGACHQGDGEGREALDLTLRPGEGLFKEPYVTLIRSGIAGVIQVKGYDQRDPMSYATYPPLRSLSASSQLVDYAASGRHHDVRVPAPQLRQLIGWVNAMGPYRGAEEIRALDDPRCAEAPRVLRP